MSRRQRPSIPSPISPSIPDEIAQLSLPEVKERLARNSRVLNTGLFSSPTPSIPSPSATQGTTSPIISNGPNGMVSSPSLPTQIPNRPMRGGSISLGTSPTDPVRDKLLRVREALLVRERELTMIQAAESMDNLQLNTQSGMNIGGEINGESSETARRRNSERGGVGQVAGIGTSGKRAALVSIREKERNVVMNRVILPVAESLNLATRDFDNNTAAQLSQLSITPTQSSSPKSRNKNLKLTPYPESPSTPNRLSRKYDSSDEISRAEHVARMSAFMTHKDQYRAEEGGEGDEGVDEVDGIFDFDEPDYDDNIDKMATGRKNRRERGTGEMVDTFGEDDERFAEGNEDYELGGGSYKEEMGMR